MSRTFTASPALTGNQGISNKALELTMRDTLEGLADAAGYFAYRPGSQILEILSIEAPHRRQSGQKPAKIIPVNQDRHRSRDIVDFLIQRERRLDQFLG